MKFIKNYMIQIFIKDKILSNYENVCVSIAIRIICLVGGGGW